MVIVECFYYLLCKQSIAATIGFHRVVQMNCHVNCAFLHGPYIICSGKLQPTWKGSVEHANKARQMPFTCVFLKWWQQIILLTFSEGTAPYNISLFTPGRGSHNEGSRLTSSLVVVVCCPQAIMRHQSLHFIGNGPEKILKWNCYYKDKRRINPILIPLLLSNCRIVDYNSR